MWKTTNQEAVGRSHIAKNVPCQDKTISISYNGVNSIVLADGAGSARLSHHGADKTTKMVANFLCDNFDDIFEKEDSQSVSEMIINYIKGGLREQSRELDCSIKDLSSTLLAAAIKDDKYILIHLGDGVVGFSRDGELKIASRPTNGKFTNQTVFTTSEGAVHHIKLFKGNIGSIEAFILMSDGSADSLYDKKNGTLSIGINRLIEYTKVFNKKDIDRYTKSTLDQVIVPNTLDDCSIAIIAYKPDDSLAFAKLPLQVKCNILRMDIRTERGIKKYENILKELDSPKTAMQIARGVGTRRLKYIKRDLKALRRSRIVGVLGNKYYRLVD